ncbi:uridine kinase [Deinococcus sp. SDU3-2]|uniref:Uridine kinase n=1 Tax=Deinococcus terrestris TaxID=2651870 RepID=A0A7X1NT47_9DEIO|nr:uridine kinase [Deinococcus terrestris]MPY65258.1 uridine kinase [Deinococcus terrestris]
MSVRAGLLAALADRLEAQPAAPVLRVAVDGVDGAGKTTFADELAEALRARGQTVIRASIDGFHAPRAVRYRRGRTSPEGFYRDSYDLAGLRSALLDPLGPGGSGRYHTAIFDHTTDSPVQEPERVTLPGSVLIVDGLFLHRPELRGVWDDSVFLRVPFEVSVPRGAARGPEYGSPNPQAESNRRYVEGNRLYFREADPERHAGVLVDNTDLAAPFLVRLSPVGAPREATAPAG